MTNEKKIFDIFKHLNLEGSRTIKLELTVDWESQTYKIYQLYYKENADGTVMTDKDHELIRHCKIEIKESNRRGIVGYDINAS